MLAISAPGAASLIPLANAVEQAANNLNLFLYGFQTLWVCSEGRSGVEKPTDAFWGKALASSG